MCVRYVIALYCHMWWGHNFNLSTWKAEVGGLSIPSQSHYVYQWLVLTRHEFSFEIDPLLSHKLVVLVYTYNLHTQEIGSESSSRAPSAREKEERREKGQEIGRK